MKETLEVLQAWWGLLLAFVTAVAATWRYAARPLYRKAAAFFKRISVTCDKVDVMSVALGPNGGSSLADEIRRIGKAQIEQVSEQRLTALRVTAISDVIERPIFEADGEGMFIRVNRAFELLFGHSVADLVGMGWVNLVEPDDRDRLIKEWRYAVEDRRRFRSQARFVTRSGSQLLVNMSAQPTVDRQGDHLIGWLGSVEVLVVKAQGAA